MSKEDFMAALEAEANHRERAAAYGIIADIERATGIAVPDDAWDLKGENISLYGYRVRRLYGVYGSGEHIEISGRVTMTTRHWFRTSETSAVRSDYITSPAKLLRALKEWEPYYA
jgi:hypothetical protein